MSEGINDGTVRAAGGIMERIGGAKVKWVKLSSIATVITGTKLEVIADGLEYAYINAGIPDSGHTDKTNHDGDVVTTPSRGNIGYVGYQGEKFWLGPLCYCIEPIDRNIVISKYLYYYLQSIKDEIVSLKHVGGVPSLNAADLKNLIIPLPSLAVQQEIVHILDRFSGYEAELEAELKAELKARKKQYGWYGDELIRNAEGAEYVAISDYCHITSGGDVPHNRLSSEKTDIFVIPVISNGTGQNALYGFTDNAKINSPAVTIAARGTIGYAEYRDYPYFPVIRLLTVIPKDTGQLDTKYLYYCLQNKEYDVPTTGIPQLTIPMLSKVTIPLPSLATQRRIVSILDRFDTLTNSLTAGLPAEIEKVHRQYEYYRDLLLSFGRSSDIKAA